MTVPSPAQAGHGETETNWPNMDRAARRTSPVPPHVPQVVLLLIAFPYIVGPRFVNTLFAKGGTKEIDRAFRNPPVSSEQLIDFDA